MTNNELFINATRANYQFPFRGMINVIDLWDLSLTNLDSVFKTLNAEAKKSEEESLLNTKSKEDEEISNKIEIVKYIVGVKLDEKKKREDAKKLDKQGKYMYRIKDLSWWEEELPTDEEMQHGLEILKENNNTVDYIVTHSPSTSELYLIGGKGLYEPDVLTNYLEEVKTATEYKKHLFGHMHLNKAINDRDICLYEQIIRIL